MRLHRIRVEHFRGIDAQEVAFPTSGVTIVEAPNEAGKTSLLEAVRLLFDYKDSSNAQPVRDVQPVGRDVGSLVEVELSCGDYRLTCRKRFHRDRLTELAISEPVAEQLHGDEAHQRLQQVLNDHVDRALLAALWFAQGEAMQQVTLGESRTLTRALDHVAGASTDPRADDLFNAVQAERARWFTPKAGNPQQHLKRLDERVDELEGRVDELRRRLEALQHDIDRSAQIDRELADLEQRRRDLTPQVDAYRRQLEQIEQLRAAVERHHQAAELAKAHRDAAQYQIDRRAALATSIRELRSNLDDLDERIASHQQEVNQLDQRVTELQQQRDAAETDAQAARRIAQQRGEDVELLDQRRTLDEQRAIQQKVSEADERARDAEAFLAACQVTDARLEAIDDVHQELRVADAQLQAGAPTVAVEALEDVAVAIDDEHTPLEAGQRREVTVAEQTRLVIGDLAQVTVRPGTSLAELTEARREAAARLQEACQAAGVSDRNEAHRLARQRQEAEATVSGRDKRVAELLGTTTRESLAEELHQLAPRVEGRLASRPDDEPLPADIDEAASRRDASEAAAEEAERHLTELRDLLDALAPRLATAREQLVEQRTRRESAAEQLEQDEAALSEARRDRADDDLAASRDEHERQRRDADAARHQASDQLDADQPEQVELLAHNAEEQLRDVEQQLRQLRDERVEVRARSEATGEEGLGQRLQEAEAERERAIRDRHREWRRAQAAKLLHDIMAEERERAQAAYRQPLQEAIERLGRLVYDESFAVEVNEDLSVPRRTFKGTTVTWEQLSGGAKEQLAILSALACGRLIDEGGAPLVLDDALGFTDPDRLERMGAVLAAAGRDCQVIVLTCTADRYRHVGGATTRRLLRQTHSVTASAAAAPLPTAATERTGSNDGGATGNGSENGSGNGSGRYRCGVCREPGHNARTCPERTA